jgi:hypothetical protein
MKIGNLEAFRKVTSQVVQTTKPNSADHEMSSKEWLENIVSTRK